jgi:hypothetical protein
MVEYVGAFLALLQEMAMNAVMMKLAPPMSMSIFAATVFSSVGSIPRMT